MKTSVEPWSRARKRAVAALSAMALMLGVAFGAAVVAAPSASAAVASCPAGQSCTWINTNYEGGRSQFEFNIRDFSAWAGYDNSASSTYSNGQNELCQANYYDLKDYDNAGLYAPLFHVPGAKKPNLSNYPRGNDGLTWNNAISSGKFVCP